MARFYKSAGANPLDYMYRENIPLMEKVLTTNEGYITGSLNQADHLSDMTDWKHLAGDDEDAQTIAKEYQDKIDAISNTIKDSPMDWRKQLSPIRDLTRSLKDDYTNGAISKQLGNYNKRASDFAAIDKQVELYHTSGGTKGTDPTRAGLAKKYYDSQFTKTGYNSDDNTFNLYKGGTLMDNIDIPKRLSAGFDKLKADGTIKVRKGLTGNQEYFDEETNKWKGLTPAKILSLVTDKAKGDTELWDYLKQDSDIGHISGVFQPHDILDAQGNVIVPKGAPINPYSVNTPAKSDKEIATINDLKSKISKVKPGAVKQRMQNDLDNYVQNLDDRSQLSWNNQSYLAPIYKGIVDQFSYNETDNESKLSPNSIWSTKYNAGQAWGRQTRQLAQADAHFKSTQQGINDRFKENMDWDKYKWDNPHTKPAAGASSSSSSGSKNIGSLIPIPVETTTAPLATNSFEGIMTTDQNGKPVPLLSVRGLSSQIDASKDAKAIVDNHLKSINNKLASGNLSSDERNQLQLQQQDLQKKSDKMGADLSDIRNYYKMTDEAVLSNNPKAGTPLTKDEIALYKEFQNDKDGSKYREYIDQLKLKHPNTGTISGTASKDIQGQKDNAVLPANVFGTDNNSNSRLKNKGGVEAPEVVAARNKLANYLATKARVDKNRDQFLSEMRKSYISTDAIVPNAKEGQEVKDMVFNFPQGSELFDDMGHKTSDNTLQNSSTKWFSAHPEDHKYNMSFVGNNNLIDYIHKYNVGVNVQQVGGTTKLGNGTPVVKVTFDDPQGNLPKGKPFYISTSSNLGHDIANKFKDHKNPDVAKIAASIGDDEANDLRNQFAAPDTRTLTGNDSPQRTIFVTSPNGTKIPIYVTEMEGGHLHIEYDSKDNGRQPLKRVDGTGKDGFYNGPEDFIEQYGGLKKLSSQINK